MINVEVVHVKNYGKTSKVLSPSEVYIYCGRPSKLGNPYYMANESQRNDVIVKCRNDVKFLQVVEDFVSWIEANEYSSIKLGCFCAPKACHCDIIKDIIHKAV